MRSRRLVVLAHACVLVAAARPADAYTTRLHIAIANDLREQLIASGDGRVALLLGGFEVRLAAEDADAIVDHPLEFRAGAIGPDNFMFPAMTDPTHAIGLRPYDQCQLLYEAAVRPEERAYALGCFLHGATDAIAHHYVNFMTGETFTLAPISDGRQGSLSNVVRHIVAEAMIQDAALAQRPELFEQSRMFHAIPQGFVLRTYLDETSGLWQLMATHALARYDAAVAANPGGSLFEVLAGSDLAPAEHLTLLPVYLREIDQLVVGLRGLVEAEIARMQDPGDPDGAALGVTAGADGRLGTSDDDTDCAVTCPVAYATYFTYVGMLAPRQDAGGSPLPPAFDKITEKLRADLFGLMPAYVSTIEAISAALNGELAAGSTGLDLDPAVLDAALAPMRQWAAEITTIDFNTLVRAVVPDFLLDLESLLNAAGVNVSIEGLLRAVFQPVIDEVNAAIEAFVIDAAQELVGELLGRLEAERAAIEAEFLAQLAASAPDGAGGDHALDDLFASGLWGHSFNIAAVTLAARETALPDGDAFGGLGPASFDASYTATWMQAGVCDYMRDAVFPLGTDLAGLLSLVRDGEPLPARIDADSPVECHAGSLAAFAAAPDADSCRLVDLDALVAEPVGSVSRAYPPSAVGAQVACRNIAVPGLPEPPAAGCGCRVGADPGRGGAGRGLGALLLGLGALLVVRRRGRGRPGARRRDVRAPYVGGGGRGRAARAAIAIAAVLVATGVTAMVGGCGGQTGDGGPDGGDDNPRAALLAALGDSVWHGTADRGGVTRAVELEFRADSLLWGELVNPFGPARRRQMRSMRVDDDGRSVSTTVITPAGWEIDPDNGRTDDWTFEIADADEPGARRLIVTRDGQVEEYAEGPTPAPDGGLTAVARVFAPGGVVDDAFCDSGISGFDYNVLFDFARGQTSEPILGQEVVVGAPLLRWQDLSGGNNFAITDVPGFDRLGGTALSDQFNFMVTYTGTIAHPGGALAMRERDDSVEDAVWVFLGDDVGSESTADLFLEVHGFVFPDKTADEPSVALPAGDTPIEIILVRCDQAITAVDVEIDLGGGFQLVGDAPSAPAVSEALLPPLF